MAASQKRECAANSTSVIRPPRGPPPRKPPPRRPEEKSSETEDINDRGDESKWGDDGGKGEAKAAGRDERCKDPDHGNGEQEFKLTSLGESESDSDESFTMDTLALDIGAINGEDEAQRKRSAGKNNASFHLDQSFIRIEGGFEIRNTGLQRTPKGDGDDDGGSSSVEVMKFSTDGNNHAKDSLVTMAVLGRGGSGIVKKALHVPTLVLVAQKEVHIFDDDKRHQMVRSRCESCDSGLHTCI